MIHISVTLSQLHALSEGQVPTDVKEEAKRWLNQTISKSDRYFRVTCIESHGEVENSTEINVQAPNTELCTFDNIRVAVLLELWDCDFLEDDPYNRDYVYVNTGCGLTLTGHAVEVVGRENILSMTSEASTPWLYLDELSLQCADNYRTGKDARYWHPLYLPDAYEESSLTDGRYYKFIYREDSFSRELLIPVLKVHEHQSEMEPEEILYEASKLWEDYWAESSDKCYLYYERNFQCDFEIYDRFGDPIPTKD